MEINSRNSVTLRTDIAYNVLHHGHFIRDARTLLMLAAADIEMHVKLGVAQAHDIKALANVRAAIESLKDAAA